MKRETFRYYQVVATNKVMVIDSHDVVVFITYDQFGGIEGINFHYGTEKIEQSFVKPCPHVTEIFKRVSGEFSSHKDKSEKKRILLAIKLFTNAFIVGTL
jgi:hypothetical protein